MGQQPVQRLSGLPHHQGGAGVRHLPQLMHHCVDDLRVIIPQRQVKGARRCVEEGDAIFPQQPDALSFYEGRGSIPERRALRRLPNLSNIRCIQKRADM